MEKHVWYGSWQSPISTELAISSSISFSDITSHPTNENLIYWVECRPNEGGKYILIEYNIKEKIMRNCFENFEQFSVRSLIHEYGGKSIVIHEDNIYFTNYKDQLIYNLKNQKPITQNSNHRHADGVYDKTRNKLIYVREDHSKVVNENNKQEPENLIVSIDLKDNKEIILAKGNDFYAFPRLSNSGNQLTYLSWNHPNMQWDNSYIYIVNLNEEGEPIESTRKRIINNNLDNNYEESCAEPKFSLDDKELYFISDRTNGFWNLHTYSFEDQMINNLMNKEEEMGGPLWQMGRCCNELLNDKEIICSVKGKLYIFNKETKEWKNIKSPFQSHIYLALSCDKSKLFCVASSPLQPTSICQLDLTSDNYEITILKQAFHNTIEEGYISVPEKIAYPTSDNEIAYAYYYPPKNKDYSVTVDSNNEKPPLICFVHGGPTSCVFTDFNFKTLYWTTRGFAVLHLDYRGSTGYGRNYRNSLYKRWGIADAQDACHGALYLVDKGLVDKKRLVISGGSAGGFTVLNCLCFFNNSFKEKIFSAGASYYGISDMEIFVKDAIKFESRYIYNLIEKENLKERSPIYYVDKLNVPIVLFQGDEDKIVLPNQSEMMYEAVKKKGIPVCYCLFKGEQHGFRKAENIKTCLEGEYYFYCKVLGIENNVESSIKIDNL
ncbi:hypothetical protein ABK040_003486 [Willaertia magna]